MSSPRTETTVRSDTPADEPKGFRLNPVQVAAGALAAVSSAVGASFFGVAGTLIGAALGSVIASVSTALYTESLRKTNEGIKRVLTRRSADGAPPVAGPVTAVLPAHLSPRHAPEERGGLRWSRVGGYAAAVFVAAMFIVTGIELVGQQPVSALVGDTASSGSTTLGQLTNASSERDSTPSTPPAPTTDAPGTAPANGRSQDAEDDGEVTEGTPATSSAAPSSLEEPGSGQSGARSSTSGASSSSPAPTGVAEATPTP
jgi:hypothetical protein